MKKLTLLAICTWFLTLHDSQAGFERRDQGARPIGMGGAFVGLADNAWAVAFNPAGLGHLHGEEFSAFYSPQPFGLPELSVASFVYVQPTPIGSFAISGNRFGFSLYRELSGTVSYAIAHQDIFSIGFNINYNSLTIRNYGSTSAIGVDIGLMTTITKGLRWGFFAANINSPSIGQSKEKLPQIYASGLSYSPLKGVSIALDVTKDVRYPAFLKGGLEYKFLDVVSLRAGSGNNPTKFSSGLGIEYSFFQFDYALTTHQELNLSHQFSVTVNFRRQ